MFIAVVAFRLILTVSQLSMTAKQKKTKKYKGKEALIEGVNGVNRLATKGEKYY